MARMCKDCQQVPLSGKRVFCDKCSTARRTDYKRQWQSKKLEQGEKARSPGMWEIIWDALPVDDGGFRPGARFQFIDIQNMLTARTLFDGSRVANVRNQRQYVVRDGRLLMQAR